MAGTAGVTGPAAATPASRPVFGAAGAGDPYHPEDGNGGYEVDHYDVSVRYNPATHQLQGVARITATATETLKGFNLDLLGLTVDAVLVNSALAPNHRESAHELVIRPHAVLASGQRFTVTVVYHGVPDPNGAWYYSPSGGAFAVGEPEAASSWFPVNETTRDKATFALHATVPTGWSVVSNGLPGKGASQAGWSTFNWRESTPITGYLTTIVIDHFTYLSQKRSNGMPILSAFAPGTQANLPVEKLVPQILDFEESLFGKYPIDTGGGIYEYGPFSAGLETQGRSFYMIAEGQTGTATVRNVVHENAHQWWGDSVSLQNWSDICLNECVAAYTEDLWSAAKDGLDLDAQYRSVVAQNLTNTDFWSAKLRDDGVDSEMFNAVYYRGPLFMHALRHQVGDSAFFAALKAFPSMHRNSTATLQQLLQLLEQKSGQDLSAFAHAWLDSTTIPANQFLWPGTLTPTT
ncbi:MAG: M1 family metallopeptidase [Actinomycetota bacterium]|nr:M1 family metallopeptidase [Actinomycetota bacterium]